jgi:hypothetical protein
LDVSDENAFRQDLLSSIFRFVLTNYTIYHKIKRIKKRIGHGKSYYLFS